MLPGGSLQFELFIVSTNRKRRDGGFRSVTAAPGANVPRQHDCPQWEACGVHVTSLGRRKSRVTQGVVCFCRFRALGRVPVDSRAEGKQSNLSPRTLSAYIVNVCSVLFFSS